MYFPEGITFNELVFEIDDNDSREWKNIHLPEVNSLKINVVSKKGYFDKINYHRLEEMKHIQNVDTVKFLKLTEAQIYQLDLRNFSHLKKLSIWDYFDHFFDNFQNTGCIEVSKNTIVDFVLIVRPNAEKSYTICFQQTIPFRSDDNLYLKYEFETPLKKSQSPIIHQRIYDESHKEIEHLEIQMMKNFWNQVESDTLHLSNEMLDEEFKFSPVKNIKKLYLSECKFKNAKIFVNHIDELTVDSPSRINGMQFYQLERTKISKLRFTFGKIFTFISWDTIYLPKVTLLEFEDLEPNANFRYGLSKIQDIRNPENVEILTFKKMQISFLNVLEFSNLKEVNFLDCYFQANRNKNVSLEKTSVSFSIEEIDLETINNNIWQLVK
jgi:hypothetical protein